MPVIKLQSSDGEIFEVEVDIAKASNTIKTMIEGIKLFEICKGMKPTAALCRSCCIYYTFFTYKRAEFSTD